MTEMSSMRNAGVPSLAASCSRSDQSTNGRIAAAHRSIASANTGSRSSELACHADPLRALAGEHECNAPRARLARLTDCLRGLRLAGRETAQTFEKILRGLRAEGRAIFHGSSMQAPRWRRDRAARRISGC